MTILVSFVCIQIELNGQICVWACCIGSGDIELFQLYINNTDNNQFLSWKVPETTTFVLTRVGLVYVCLCAWSENK